MLRLAVFAAAAIAGVRAWWCDGHMLTANIALQSGIMSAASIAKANDLITYLNTAEAGYYQSPDFVTAACWADDLKSLGALQEQNWHFIDIPVVRQPFSGTPAPVPTADTAPWAITAGHSTLYSSKATKLDKARQLRFLIHLVGDIHQPLHAAALFSDQFPTGDAGGNLYPVAGVDYTTELHAVWDSGAGLWVDDIARPLNDTGKAWLDDFSTGVMTDYPVSSLQPEIKEYNVSTWANESNALAASFVYTAPQAPTPLPDAYITQAQEICRKQLAIGGYRLADLLEYIFTATPFGQFPAGGQAPSGSNPRLEGSKAALKNYIAATNGQAPAGGMPRLRATRN